METFNAFDAYDPVPTTPPFPAPRVLAYGTAGGKRVEVVQHADGTPEIMFEGKPADSIHYRWPPGRIEPCINAFLRLMRRRPADS